MVAPIVVAMSGTGCGSKETRILSVKEAQSISLPTKEPLTVAGIVAHVSPDEPKTFTMMDVEDARCPTSVGNGLSGRLI